MQLRLHSVPVLQEAPTEMNYVYLLRCADDSLYCGWTTDPVRRLNEHNRGLGAKYTRSRLPVKLVYCEAYEERHEALSREWHLKRMSRNEKTALISSQTPLYDIPGNQTDSTDHISSCQHEKRKGRP